MRYGATTGDVQLHSVQRVWRQDRFQLQQGARALVAQTRGTNHTARARRRRPFARHGAEQPYLPPSAVCRASPRRPAWASTG